MTRALAADVPDAWRAYRRCPARSSGEGRACVVSRNVRRAFTSSELRSPSTEMEMAPVGHQRYSRRSAVGCRVMCLCAYMHGVGLEMDGRTDASIPRLGSDNEGQVTGRTSVFTGANHSARRSASGRANKICEDGQNGSNVRLNYDAALFAQHLHLPLLLFWSHTASHAISRPYYFFSFLRLVSIPRVG